LSVEVNDSGRFQSAVEVDMQDRARVAQLHADSRQRIGEAIVCSDGQRLKALFGTQFHKWPIWKCHHLPLDIASLMISRSSFAWPMFPSDVYHFGLPIPRQSLPFEDIRFEDQSGEEEEEDNDDDDHKANFEEPYHASKLLQFLKLKSLLKPSASIREVLALAADILGHDKAPVMDKATCRIPSAETLRKSLIMLDMIMMLWSRHLWRHGMKQVSCLLVDASEQSRVNYLCQRSDSLVVPENIRLDHMRKMDCNSVFLRSILPLGITGHGESDVAHKMRLVLHSAKLLTGCKESFDRWRHSIRGMCTDQACYKYTIVERLCGNELAAAWLILWARHAASHPAAYNKAEHKTYEPSLAETQAFAANVKEGTD
jgi:hypothetical protein